MHITSLGRLGLVLVLGTSLAACGKYNYTEPLTDDEKAKNERVYGEVGGPARQSKNQYEVPDDLNARVADIKVKLYGGFPGFEDYTTEAAKQEAAADGAANRQTDAATQEANQPESDQASSTGDEA